MNITGQCHCGNISFTALVDASRAIACHCADCQTFSGAPFRVVVPVPAAQLTLQGTPKHYVKTAQSGNRRAQAFCGDCGTQLYATDPAAPTVYNLRLGCVNERAAISPSKQIWHSSAMPWLKNLRDITAFTEGPESPPAVL